MLSFSSSASIGASPSRVWDALTSINAWTDWDSALDRVDGELGPSARITLHRIGSSRPFKLRVTVWEPNRLLVLTGGMPLGMFTGTRSYRLEGSADQTDFSMDEQYSGPLAPLITKSIPDLQPSFDAFVAGLREAAEH